MAAVEILEQLENYGVSIMVDQGELVLRPASKVPSDILLLVKEYKAEILTQLQHLTYSDGQPPPLDRPPQTEQELRRLIDHLADPQAFARWFEWAMREMDLSETGNL